MTPENMHVFFTELNRDEGSRNKPYKDTVGKLTIGIGRNLDDVGLSDDEIRYLCLNDIARVTIDLDTHLPWWRKLDDVRQRVLANMAFNMGIGGLLTFKNTLSAVQSGDYETASTRMMVSKWAKQVGKRAERLAFMMATGKTKGA